MTASKAVRTRDPRAVIISADGVQFCGWRDAHKPGAQRVMVCKWAIALLERAGMEIPEPEPETPDIGPAL